VRGRKTKTKAQYLAIALLSSVVMPITANAETVILSFDQDLDTNSNSPFAEAGSFFREQTLVDVGQFQSPYNTATFLIQGNEEASGLWGGSFSVEGFLAPTCGSCFPTKVDFLSGTFVDATLSGATLTISDQIGTYTSGVTSIEQLLGDGTQTSFVIGLSPSVEGVVSLNAVATPEPSTWAMMLLGFAGLALAGYRRSERLNG
jgi:hypothetical protein